jgi:quinol monooxygenase YgiN
VVVVVKVKPEFIETARPRFEWLVENSRKEAGSLRYDCYTDANEPGVLIIIEKYTNQQAFEDHKKTEHFLKLMS